MPYFKAPLGSAASPSSSRSSFFLERFGLHEDLFYGREFFPDLPLNLVNRLLHRVGAQTVCKVDIEVDKDVLGSEAHS